jgi:signal transduction histidine kinase
MTKAVFSRAWVRVLLGVGCGAAAWALNLIPVQILSSETPWFAFGGAFVLFAYRALGPLPGLLSALVGFAALGSVVEMGLVAATTYAIEGYVVSRLAERTRSLVVADVLFWLTAGAVLDALAYLWWMQLASGFVLLLLVKQLLNGVANAVLADWATRNSRIRTRLGLPATSVRAWQDVLFDRTVPVVMVPMAVIVFLLARASHSASVDRLAAHLRLAAAHASEGADAFLTTRAASLRELRLALDAARSSRGDAVARLLEEFHRAHPEYYNVFVTDDSGTVIAASPQRSSTGLSYLGRNLSHRPYFEQARQLGGRPVFGTLVLGQLHVRRAGVEPVIPVAVPRWKPDGSFGGIIMGALDAAALRAILAARSSRPEGATQLLDRAGRVVASSSPLWAPATPRAAELRAAPELADGQPAALPAPGMETYADRLGVSPRLTLVHGVSLYPFSIVADEPLSTVHQELVPTSLALIALMLLALLAVYAVARTLGAQLSSPLRAVGAVAEDLAGGEPVPREVLDRFGASAVQEIRALGTQFLRMDDALRARRDADALAVAQSEKKYRETLEQLAQAQKVEGIGRLAGGIAHDFNNLLTPIVGYTDLALSSVPADSPAKRDLALVRTAAERAKEVVGQLLAFGRAQVLDTRRIDLAESVVEFEPLLRKSLRMHHELHVVSEPGIIVEADRAKVQQVLMNLVLNAADAMPEGGRIEVHVGVQDVRHVDPSEPEPLEPGQYGVIQVGDRGVGMDELTRRRAFDPFFTTKPRGKGTGLGLSTAYGIVRQHRGTILVDSGVGLGTRMRVLLPIAASVPHLVEGAAPLPNVKITPAAPVDDGARAVMVVEDEAAVRELVRVALTRAGFRVLAARDGEEALVRAAAHPGRIDLLLSDVVMPGLSGPELARRFRQARSEARVLFMSGYASDVIAEDGALPSDAELLSKPFTPDELVARVRAVLDA